MLLKYFPAKKIVIDNIALNFNEERKFIRKKLSIDYIEDNQEIHLGDSNIEPLLIRRDIYRISNPTDLYFILSYNKSDLLTEVEVHQCEEIELLGFSFDFNDDLDSIALKLSEYSEISILNEGEIFFKDLKMVLSDKRKMGGEGNSIGYFYCASDITHIA